MHSRRFFAGGRSRRLCMHFQRFFAGERSRRLCMHSRRFFCRGALTPPLHAFPAFLLQGGAHAAFACIPGVFFCRGALTPPPLHPLRRPPRRDLFGWLARFPAGLVYGSIMRSQSDPLPIFISAVGIFDCERGCRTRGNFPPEPPCGGINPRHLSFVLQTFVCIQYDANH